MKTRVLCHVYFIENNACYKIMTRNVAETVRPMKYMMIKTCGARKM